MPVLQPGAKQDRPGTYNSTQDPYNDTLRSSECARRLAKGFADYLEPAQQPWDQSEASPHASCARVMATTHESALHREWSIPSAT